ncbi:MAG: large subunit ribosomal protein [Solirubrobacteraceae bacterium]|nr:large subunit ribosomal protein [Solirubrobacteraceae bacterium]
MADEKDTPETPEEETPEVEAEATDDTTAEAESTDETTAGAESTDETAEAPAEEKPKPKRARRSRAKKAEAEEAKDEAAEQEAEAEAAEAEGEPQAEDETAQPTTPARRRGGAAVAGRRQPARKPRREADADVSVRARARYVRCAPRKARLVIDHIRGKDIDQARAILLHTPRAASRDVLKLLDSAIANAENNHDLVADDLKIGKAYVDEGPTLKRFRPRALGRATQIRKRTSHMTIELVSKG